jgi:hypothetical protein
VRHLPTFRRTEGSVQGARCDRRAARPRNAIRGEFGAEVLLSCGVSGPLDGRRVGRGGDEAAIPPPNPDAPRPPPRASSGAVAINKAMTAAAVMARRPNGIRFVVGGQRTVIGRPPRQPLQLGDHRRRFRPSTVHPNKRMLATSRTAGRRLEHPGGAALESWLRDAQAPAGR